MNLLEVLAEVGQGRGICLGLGIQEVFFRQKVR